jgi:hypothetical protein
MQLIESRIRTDEGLERDIAQLEWIAETEKYIWDVMWSITHLMRDTSPESLHGTKYYP